MILNIFKKYSQINKKRKLIYSIIKNLEINEEQKSLYLDSIDNLWEENLDNLYKKIENFVSDIEKKDFEDIKNENFSKISWMRKKEIYEKQKEINSISFLINNL